MAIKRIIKEVNNTIKRIIERINEEKKEGLYKDSFGPMDSKKNINNFKLFSRNKERVEIRVLYKNKVYSGIFDSPLRANSEIRKYDGKANVYIGLNPVFREANNQLVRVSNAIKDMDIERRQFILIDLDPVREANTPASDEQVKAALSKASLIIEELIGDSYQFREPIIAMSGNGVHILFRVDMKNNEESKNIVKAFLKTLAKKYNDNLINVDITVFNAARITKLYGTISVKGKDSEEYPYRRSHIIHNPNNIEITETSKIQHYIEDNKTSSNIEKTKKKVEDEKIKYEHKLLELIKELDRVGIEISHINKLENKSYQIVLSKCPFNEHDEDKGTCIYYNDDGTVYFSCLHDKCKQKNNNWEKLKDMYDIKYNEKHKQQKKNDSDNKDSFKKISKADEIFNMAKDAGDVFFCDFNGDEYVAVNSDKGCEVLKIDSKRYKAIISYRYRERNNSIPNKESIQQAIIAMISEAIINEENIELFKRCSMKIENGEKVIYYDLDNKKNEIIRIDKDEIKLINHKEPIFIRTLNTSSQVVPDENFFGNTDISIITKHFRIKDRDDEILFIILLVTSIIKGIAHPILIFYGEKGSGKTINTRYIKKIIDPSRQDVVSLPKTERDFAILCSKSYLLAFDNLDSIPKQMSDFICLISTKGSYVTRALYSDDEEKVFLLDNPLVINGIGAIVSKPDLLDRCKLIEVSRIQPKDRKTEERIDEDFRNDLSKILAVLFSISSKMLSYVDIIDNENIERLADFGKYAYAIGKAIDVEEDEITRILNKSMKIINEQVIQMNPVLQAIMAYIEKEGKFEGTANELLSELDHVAEEIHIDTRINKWPKEPQVLSRRITEIKSNLLENNIIFEKANLNKGRIIRIWKDIV
ncbi:hypothetical protein ACTNDG_07140 [Clostridium sp. HCP1S3_B4]|uniref:hypothetical protein n=1 Tax=unclassified Clostridium TaxID=2614128 RepID=UPI003F888787